MKRTTEEAFLLYVAKLFEAELRQSVSIVSTTMMKELPGSREQTESILYRVAKDSNIPVERDAMRTFIHSGNYNVSDYYLELLRRISEKRNVAKLKFHHMLVILMAVLGIYNLMQANVIATVVCSSIGASILAYTTAIQQLHR
ncbi:hypothetical protein [Paenibacillus aestuarii]|uniref:DUF2877 domain-containing protein n=1 Tax=Paenibacillus aestuarii TaxID=516965 RepID=A0ABW0K4E8_9BACL|nr:hypothetical protein [Paenibacillus aestuarii]